MNIENIQALIAQGLITDVASVDPNTAYVAVGVFQPGNRQAGAAGNAYPSYAMPISEFLTGGGGVIGSGTVNYIPKWTPDGTTLGNSVIYQNGSNIGINTTNPLTKLTVSANDQSALISSVRYETVGSSPAGIVSLRARGTDLLPTALLTGDEIATFAAVGYYGAGFGTTGNANFIFYAAENFTLTNRGTSCKVGTTPLGTSSVIYNFGINSEGNVSIGIPSLNPTARLHVKGVNTMFTNYALRVDNSASSDSLFSVANNGSVGINAFGGDTLYSLTLGSKSTGAIRMFNSAFIDTLTITDAGYYNFFGGTRISIGAAANSTNSLFIEAFSALATDYSLNIASVGSLITYFAINNAGQIGVGTRTPATSALLDLTSTTGSLLVSRMTTTQKNALTAVNGMILYDTTLNKFQGYEAGAWVNLV